MHTGSNACLETPSTPHITLVHVVVRIFALSFSDRAGDYTSCAYAWRLFPSCRLLVAHLLAYLSTVTKQKLTWHRLRQTDRHNDRKHQDRARMREMGVTLKAAVDPPTPPPEKIRTISSQEMHSRTIFWASAAFTFRTETTPGINQQP